MIRILITNDDGIHSDGLIKLEEALKELGDVYVVAPASEMRSRMTTSRREYSTAPPMLCLTTTSSHPRRPKTAPLIL